MKICNSYRAVTKKKEDLMRCELALPYLEHEGMVAEFPQLHDGVHERLGSAPLGALPTGVLREHDALLLHVRVQRPLQTRHLTLDDVLHLKRPSGVL